MASHMKAWHEVVRLRDDVKSGELSLAMFAADLYDVMMQRPGGRKVYQDPVEFFALTHPSRGLRDLVADVAQRLQGKSDTAGRLLAVDYGGGKTHSLITLRHLFHDPRRLPRLPGVESFVNAIGAEPPSARIAALCFDKLDRRKGMKVLSPEGEERTLHYPWNVLAWQIAGEAGLTLIGSTGGTERDTPPTEQYLAQLLAMPIHQNQGVLILMDETLMYVRAMTDGAPEDDWWGRLSHFFQALTEAAQKTDRCALVASLRSSKQEDNDPIGQQLFANVMNIFQRLVGETAHTVDRADIPEILRRRFFTTESISQQSDYEPQAQLVARHIRQLSTALDHQGEVHDERTLVAHYPFHPDLIDTFHARWVQLRTFQRTRGMLRAFAVALRDAASWDTSPVIGPGVFLAALHDDELAEAASELARTASEHGVEEATTWRPILAGELDKARRIQQEPGCSLRHRELECAVMGVFLGSQPEPQKIGTMELVRLLAPTQPDSIVLQKALHDWTGSSWFLDENCFPVDGQPDQLPSEWRLGNQANLRQMHDVARQDIESTLVETELLKAVRNQRSFRQHSSPARLHNLPSSPRDVPDDLNFHIVLLGPEAASLPGDPNAQATEFIDRATAPRSARNAVLVAVPHRDSLREARDRVRDHLAWQKVRTQLIQDQSQDPRLDRVGDYISQSRQAMTSSIRHAWSVVVTLGRNGEYEAFHVPPSDGPLWDPILQHERSRIMASEIVVDTLLPGGPYAVWPADATSMPVTDIVNAFLRRPDLSKPLAPAAIQATIQSGVRQGTFAAYIQRPDGSRRLWWREDLGETELTDASLEVCLPESIQIDHVPSGLLEPGNLPNLWSSETDTLPVAQLTEYFAEAHQEMVDQGGFSTPMGIPQASHEIIQEAVAEAVRHGRLCVEIDGTSWLQEGMEPSAISADSVLRVPPAPLNVQDLMPGNLPAAWSEDSTHGLALLEAVADNKGHPWPWSSLCRTLQQAVDSRWLELVDGSPDLLCSRDAAAQIRLKRPRQTTPTNPEGTYRGTWTCDLVQLAGLIDAVPDIMEQLGTSRARLDLTLVLEQANAETVTRINQALADAGIGMQVR